MALAIDISPSPNHNPGMDTVTLLAVAREIEETLRGGRVQAVVQPDEDSLALEVYNRGTRHWLLLDTHPQHARIHLLPEKARRGTASDSPFLLLARKYLPGAHLDSLFQPNWERVLHLGFQHHEAGPTALVGEIMGRWSNLLLLDGDDVILEALRRFGPGQNPYRVILPGRIYQPPPPQEGKQALDQASSPDLERLLNQTPAGEPLWRVLLRRYAGLSPLLSRELVYRATGDANADVTHPNMRGEALFDALHWLRRLPREGGWLPSVALDEAGDEPAAFAPYQLSHLGPLRHYASISEAADDFYEATIGADRYAGRRAQVQTLLDEARARLQSRRASLGEQAVSEEEVEVLRASGEWILAYAWRIKPGDEEVAADTGEEVLHIPLDPALSGPENAQAYFARYQKAKKAAARVPALLAAVDRDLKYLEQLQSDLDLADNAPQIEELREALLETGLVSEDKGKKRPPMRRSQPLRLRSHDGFIVIVGRNARQNEQVTWKLAQAGDMWLHAEQGPGAHVIVKTEGREVPDGTLQQAASWAAWHSGARNDGNVSVMVTQRRHLRRFKGARPGQVRVLQYHTVTVTPAAPKEHR